MSISLLLSGINRRQNSIGSLTLEATLSENHNARSQVTNYTIEDGSTISDHIINDPVKVSIRGFVSNSPVDIGATIAAGFSGDNAQNTFDELYRIRDEKELVTVVSKYRSYENMAITNIRVPRGQQTGDAIEFTVDLLQVNVVDSASVQVFNNVLSSVDGVVDQASSALNLGRQTVSQATSATDNAVSNVVGGLF